jgi:peptidoglycan-associated lipoprotein
MADDRRLRTDFLRYPKEQLMSPSKWTLLAAVVVAASLAGCSSTKLTEPAAQAPVETRTPLATGPGSAAAAAATPAATMPAAPQSQVATVDLAKTSPVAATAGAAGPSQRVVYFDYDSFAIKDEFKGLVDGHAKALAGNRARRMVVEGHTDERGGREYNLALGQKRADAVVKAMELLGVPNNQLEAVSFGEERPAATGQDESAWAKNRRAELKDR